MHGVLLKILDVLFFGFHSVFILFNVFGWIVPRWRRLHLFALLITAFSWFGLGIWFGWGYCLCTDWHWQIREQLGYQDMSSSYVHFLIFKLTGFDLSVQLVDTVTVAVFFIALAISLYFHVRSWVSKK
jgi:hypothetical protein